MATLSELRTKLHQQEHSLREYLQRTRDNSICTKERVQTFFSELRDLLSTQEHDIIRSIDAKTSVVAESVEECLVKTAVNIGISHSIAEDVLLDRTLDDIKACLNRGEAVITSHILSYAINESAKNDIEHIQYGHFNNNDVRDDVDINTCTGPATDVDQENECDDVAVEGATHGEITQQIHTHIQEATIATVSNVLPSAPPQPESTGDEEQPPPYWQVVADPAPAYSITEGAYSCHGIGEIDPSVSWSWAEYLQYLREHPGGRDIPSLYWQLEKSDSFNVCEDDDMRKPIPVALCSHDRIICMADKNNSCVSFYTVDGIFLGSRDFETPVYDVQFFEQDGNALRFIAAFPKEYCVRIICFHDRIVKDRIRILKPRPHIQLTSACKGPLGIPFLGASAMARPCIVRTFDYNFKLDDFKNNDTNFLYPHSCLSYGSNVIVSDWNLGLVCIFAKNGRPLGRYTGTLQYPLVNPTDMTIDPEGHVYIVSGRLSTVHVIDQACNFLCALKVPESEHDKPKLVEYLDRTGVLAIVRESGQKMEMYRFNYVPHTSETYTSKTNPPTWL